MSRSQFFPAPLSPKFRSALILKKKSTVSEHTIEQPGDTELIAAIRSSDEKKILRILAANNSVTNWNVNWDSPLLVATCIGELNIIIALLSTGKFSIDIGNRQGNYPLRQAVTDGRTDIVKTFLEFQPRLTLTSDLVDCTDSHEMLALLNDHLDKQDKMATQRKAKRNHF